MAHLDWADHILPAGPVAPPVLRRARRLAGVERFRPALVNPEDCHGIYRRTDHAQPGNTWDRPAPPGSSSRPCCFGHSGGAEQHPPAVSERGWVVAFCFDWHGFGFASVLVDSVWAADAGLGIGGIQCGVEIGQPPSWRFFCRSPLDCGPPGFTNGSPSIWSRLRHAGRDLMVERIFEVKWLPFERPRPRCASEPALRACTW